jgi:tetratricopeptide (TPR) repeat protein
MNPLRCIAVLLVSAAALFAEDFVLVDGRYLQVKILESDAAGMQVEILETGGRVFIPWDRVVEKDRLRIMKARGHIEERREVPTELGNKLVMKSGDTFLGRVVKETPQEVTLRSEGVDVAYPRAQIVEMSQEMVPINAIEKPDTLFAAKLKEAAPADDDIAAQRDLAEFAEVLGLYEEAIRRYLKVQAADPEYEAILIKTRLTTLEALAKNKNFRDAMAEARRLGNAALFKRSFALLDELEKIPDVPDSLKSEVRALRDWTMRKRNEHYRLLVRERYLVAVRAKIDAMSRNEKLKLTEAQQQLRSQVHKEVVADLAQKLELDPKELEAFWKDRRFQAARYASYGSGTFIVLGVSQKAQQQQAELQRILMQDLARRNQQQGRNNQGGSLSAPQPTLPKPPTKEEWWASASANERANWMMCFWAENSKQVEVLSETRSDCTRCGGNGSLPFAGGQGETLKVTCPSCQGHSTYKGVSYK